jgi:predicted  nucleic acid-binding Zn-ribbon protein
MQGGNAYQTDQNTARSVVDKPAAGTDAHSPGTSTTMSPADAQNFAPPMHGGHADQNEPSTAKSVTGKSAAGIEAHSPGTSTTMSVASTHTAKSDAGTQTAQSDTGADALTAVAGANNTARTGSNMDHVIGRDPDNQTPSVSRQNADVSSRDGGAVILGSDPADKEQDNSIMETPRWMDYSICGSVADTPGSEAGYDAEALMRIKNDQIQALKDALNKAVHASQDMVNKVHMDAQQSSAEAAKLKEELARLEAEKNDRKAEINALTKQLASAKQQVEKLKADVLSANKKFDATQVQLDATKAQLEATAKENEENAEKLKRATEEASQGKEAFLDDARRAKDEANMLKKQLIASTKELASMNEKVSDAEKTIETLQEEFHTASIQFKASKEKLRETMQKLEELQEAAGKARELESQVNELQKEIEALKRKLNEKTDRSSSVETSVEEYRNRVLMMDKVRQRAERDLTEAQSTIASLEQQLARLNQGQNDQEKAKMEVEKIKRDVDARIEALQRELREAKEQIYTLEKQLEQSKRQVDVSRQQSSRSSLRSSNSTAREYPNDTSRNDSGDQKQLQSKAEQQRGGQSLNSSDTFFGALPLSLPLPGWMAPFSGNDSRAQTEGSSQRVAGGGGGGGGGDRSSYDRRSVQRVEFADTSEHQSEGGRTERRRSIGGLDGQSDRHGDENDDAWGRQEDPDAYKRGSSYGQDPARHTDKHSDASKLGKQERSGDQLSIDLYGMDKAGSSARFSSRTDRSNTRGGGDRYGPGEYDVRGAENRSSSRGPGVEASSEELQVLREQLQVAMRAAKIADAVANGKHAYVMYVCVFSGGNV